MGRLVKRLLAKKRCVRDLRPEKVLLERFVRWLLPRFNTVREERPAKVPSYFTQESARENLSKTIVRYNSARNNIIQQKEAHITAVRHYWESPALFEELQVVYDYLENSLHQQGIYPLEFSVNEPLSLALTREMSMSKGKEQAQSGAENGIKSLNPMIENFETLKHNILNHLTSEL